jgi:heme/copper-type cytochrome/quinol oxidase subunit 3
MGQHMEQVKVPLKMGFFPFLVTDLAIFRFLMLPTCLLSCSKEVLTRLSQKKIIKAAKIPKIMAVPLIMETTYDIMIME